MPLQLTIVTPEGVRFEGPVERVVVPGTEGDFGVLPGHERFLSPVRIGEAELELPGGNRLYAAIGEGFAEVTTDKTVLMVDTCEFATDVDLSRAERAKARAERELERLRQGRMDEVTFKLEEAALYRAVIRIQVAGKGARPL
jgi:F-type H+-transporting ATPase subunit epsilon